MKIYRLASTIEFEDFGGRTFAVDTNDARMWEFYGSEISTLASMRHPFFHPGPGATGEIVDKLISDGFLIEVKDSCEAKPLDRIESLARTEMSAEVAALMPAPPTVSTS